MSPIVKPFLFLSSFKCMVRNSCDGMEEDKALRDSCTHTSEALKQQQAQNFQYSVFIQEKGYPY